MPITGYSNTISVTTLAPSFDTDYQAVLNYATTQGYTLPSAGQQTLQNQLVLDLKTAGVWSKLDTFGVFATDGDSDFALIDWIRLSDYTAVNSPTFTADKGFQGNGTSSYIDMNYNPSTQAVNLSLNNNSIGVFQDINNAPVGAMISAFGVNYLEILNDNANSRLISYNMSQFGDVPSVGANSQNGLFTASRSALTTYSIYKNATLIALPIRNSVAIPNVNMRFLARSNNSVYGQGRIGMGFAGASLTATEVTDLQTAFKTNYYDLL
jgi:hypothetical protein